MVLVLWVPITSLICTAGVAAARYSPVMATLSFMFSVLNGSPADLVVPTRCHPDMGQACLSHVSKLSIHGDFC